MTSKVIGGSAREHVRTEVSLPQSLFISLMGNTISVLWWMRESKPRLYDMGKYECDDTERNRYARQPLACWRINQLGSPEGRAPHPNTTNLPEWASKEIIGRHTVALKISPCRWSTNGVATSS